MDALKALANQQGCAADGTAAQRNPLSQFVHQSMGGGPQQQMPGGPMQQHGPGVGQQRSDIDAGMAAGMGITAGPRGPAMMGPGAAPAFVQEFEQMRASGGPPRGPMMAGPMGRGPRGPDAWVNDFERMKLGGPPQHNIQMEAAYRNSFARAPRPMGQRWAGQMAARPPPSRMDRAWQATAAPPPAAEQWAQEVAGPKEAPDAEKWAEEAAKEVEQTAENPDMEATRRATDDLVKVMASNEKFRNSEFFSFMSKVNDGELAFENNTVVETGVKKPANLDQAWDKADAPDSLEGAWNENAMNKMEEVFAKAWEDSQAGKQVDFEKVYADALQDAGFNAEAAAPSLEQAWGQTTQQVGNQPYELAQDNPFAKETNAFEKGMEFFNQGQLQDAILAFEACVSQDQTHSDAWHMLGKSHQEMDEDSKAILCLEKCLEMDGYHLDALLDLGVSYVNELDQQKSLITLKTWVENNPNFQGLELPEDVYGDDSLIDNVMQLMLKASSWAPKDANVAEVLGVLYNVSRDYESAAHQFEKALAQRPDDYSLWNKLGATLANSGRSEEALDKYQKAIELKPRYARCWLNRGISMSNLGNYEMACQSYLKALELNPGATHIWSYIRICCTCLERFDLIGACDRRNLEALKLEFGAQ